MITHTLVSYMLASVRSTGGPGAPRPRTRQESLRNRTEAAGGRSMSASGSASPEWETSRRPHLTVVSDHHGSLENRWGPLGTSWVRIPPPPLVGLISLAPGRNWAADGRSVAGLAPAAGGTSVAPSRRLAGLWRSHADRAGFGAAGACWLPLREGDARRGSRRHAAQPGPELLTRVRSALGK